MPSALPWVLGGHAGLILQGVDLEDDLELDVCTSEAGVMHIAELFAEDVIEPASRVTMDHLHALRLRLSLESTLVEVFGDPEIRVGPDDWVGLPLENIHTIEWEGQPLRVFTLESEHRLYAAATWKPERNAVIAEKIAATLRARDGS